MSFKSSVIYGGSGISHNSSIAFKSSNPDLLNLISLHIWEIWVIVHSKTPPCSFLASPLTRGGLESCPPQMRGMSVRTGGVWSISPLTKGGLRGVFESNLIIFQTFKLFQGHKTSQVSREICL
ncbi:MAG: hypothetical protein LBQ59_05080 [Candidatus Peribacteria bacterium]|nr:hypothetical protein [Candidatus Peribacteria bacterium]